MKAEIANLAALHDLLEHVCADHGGPLVEMSEEEKSEFRFKTWSGQYGPALGRIGNYVIYFDGQQDQTPK